MDQLIMNYIMQGVYTLALLAVGYLWKSVKTTRQDNHLIKDGIRALLRDRIIHKCEKCIAGGYCTTEYHDEIMILYEDYRALGGNGTAEKLIKHIDKLPVIPKEHTDGKDS